MKNPCAACNHLNGPLEDSDGHRMCAVCKEEWEKIRSGSHTVRSRSVLQLYIDTQVRIFAPNIPRRKLRFVGSLTTPQMLKMARLFTEIRSVTTIAA